MKPKTVNNIEVIYKLPPKPKNIQSDYFVLHFVIANIFIHAVTAIK